MDHSRSCCISHPFLEFWNVSCPPVEMWNLSMQSQLVRVILIWFTFTGICRYFKNSTGNLPILNQPVCTIPLGSWVPKIGDPNSRPLAMLRPHASLSSALNMLVQGMFCVHFPGTEYCMLEMQRLLWCSCLHFLWQLTAEVQHQFHLKLDISWNYWLYYVAEVISYACTHCWLQLESAQYQLWMKMIRCLTLTREGTPF